MVFIVLDSKSACTAIVTCNSLPNITSKFTFSYVHDNREHVGSKALQDTLTRLIMMKHTHMSMSLYLRHKWKTIAIRQLPVFKDDGRSSSPKIPTY